MPVIKINAITVPEDSGDELAKRFAARAGAVVTRWRDEAAFEAWVSSPAFGHGHRSEQERSGGDAPPPVAVSSELWSYVTAGGAGGSIDRTVEEEATRR